MHTCFFVCNPHYKIITKKFQILTSIKIYDKIIKNKEGMYLLMYNNVDEYLKQKRTEKFTEEYIKKAIKREEENETNIFIVEAALLIEDKYDEICDELWYIYADEETRMERLKQNRGYSEEKCRSIFRNQLSEDEFSNHCDFEIDNSDDFEKTKEQIQQKMQRMQIDEVM